MSDSWSILELRDPHGLLLLFQSIKVNVQAASRPAECAELRRLFADKGSKTVARNLQLSVMNTIVEALADVEHAFRHLEFAIKLMCYCEGGHLNLETFDADTTILLNTENVGFPTKHFSSNEAVIAASQALVGMAFGTSAMVLEAAFEVAGLSRKPKSRLPADELRTLVFMVRCAFAHNPALPLWEARGPEHARIVSVALQGSPFSIDLSSLHGQPFDYEHIGGFANWLKIKNESLALLQ